ncbi:MAG: hypothetical protein ABFR31_01785 [Thermodesulfobacteriota bacterium]
MADEINVDKLKSDAFEAIDTLFSEDDENTSFQEEQVSEEMKQTSDDFSMLKEYSLALEWEYSDREIGRLARHLDKIARKNPDHYTQSLVKLVKNIIKYLQKAREKSFPQTLSVMTSVIETIKDINTKNFNKDEIKFEFNSARKEIIRLKENILKYNKKLRQHSSEEQNITVLERLDHLENKISYLEKQNSALKRLIIDQHQDAAAMPVSNLNSNIEDNTDSELIKNSFSSNNELMNSVEEVVTVDVEDISPDLPNLPAKTEEANQ